MVFYSDADRAMYLQLLHRQCTRAAVRVTGYCLMGNHVHLILAPEKETSLAQALGRAHTDYARWLNLRRGETGHLWQNRYYSCPLDEPHQWEALRYIELNPVRAGLAADGAAWPWSSARAHLMGVDPSGILDIGDAGLVERIRDATRTGRPAGGTEFIEHWEQRLGRQLRPAKRGPTPKASAEDGQMELGVW
jgi:putative transposase